MLIFADMGVAVWVGGCWSGKVTRAILIEITMRQIGVMGLWK